jgi:hypothetical protein
MHVIQSCLVAFNRYVMLCGVKTWTEGFAHKGQSLLPLFTFRSLFMVKIVEELVSI